MTAEKAIATDVGQGPQHIRPMLTYFFLAAITFEL